MNSYVVGFIFNPELTKVVLISKTHPAWQKGKLNGIGGALHEGETPAAAMARESEEEAGVKTIEAAWKHFLRMRRPDVAVDFFAHVHRGDKGDIRTTTDEAVAWYEVAALPQNVLSNIRWMVPLALDSLTDTKLSFTEVMYNANND